MKASTNFLFAAAFLVSSFSFGQILSPERIKNRVKQRAEDRAASEVDNRVDRGVDKVLDGLFGTVDKGAKAATDAVKDSGNKEKGEDSATEKSQEPSEEDVMGAFSKIMGGMGQGAAPENSYSFNSSYTMKMTSTEKNKAPQNFTIKYLFTESGDYFGSKVLGMSTEVTEAIQDQFMLFDMEKNTMYTFMNMNGQKNMISMSLSGVEEVAEEKIDASIENTSYTSTGKTKTIAGYPCEGFLMKQDNEEYLVWISKSSVPVISAYYKNFNKALNSSSKSLKFNYASNPQMMKMMQQGRAFMGMEFEDKGTKTEMEVVEIKPRESFSFETTGYSNMMDFNKIMQDAQKQNKN